MRSFITGKDLSNYPKAEILAEELNRSINKKKITPVNPNKYIKSTKEKNILKKLKTKSGRRLDFINKLIDSSIPNWGNIKIKVA